MTEKELLEVAKQYVILGEDHPLRAEFADYPASFVLCPADAQKTDVLLISLLSLSALGTDCSTRPCRILVVTRLQLTEPAIQSTCWQQAPAAPYGTDRVTMTRYIPLLKEFTCPIYLRVMAKIPRTDCLLDTDPEE